MNPAKDKITDISERCMLLSVQGIFMAARQKRHAKASSESLKYMINSMSNLKLRKSNFRLVEGYVMKRYTPVKKEDEINEFF